MIVAIKITSIIVSTHFKIPIIFFHNKIIINGIFVD